MSTNPWGDIVPEQFNCTERGANLLTRTDGRVHFIKRLDETHWLNICYTPDNYPSFEVELLEMTTDKLAKQLTKSYEEEQITVLKMNDFVPQLDENLYLTRFDVRTKEKT